MHPRLKPCGLKHGVDGRGAARDDVHILHGFARRIHRGDFAIELFAHLLGIKLGVGAAWTVDLNLGDLPHGGKRFEIGPRHTAGTDHSHHVAVLARVIFHPQTGAACDAHMLEKTVVDKSNRDAVAGAEHDQHTEVGAGLNAVFVFPLIAFLSGPADDVRKHPRHDNSVSLGPSGHQRPTVVTLRSFAGQINIDAPHGCRVAPADLFLRLVEGLQSHRHGQNLFYIVIF